MKNLDMENEYFRRAIRYYADEANGWGGQTRLAEIYGCKNTYINMIINGAKQPSYKVQQKFAQILKTDRDSLLNLGKSLPETVENTGKFNTELPLFQMQSPPPPAPDCKLCNLKDEADKKHQEGFKDKERAIRLNQKLVELEKLSPEQLDNVESMLNGLLLTEREKKGLSGIQMQKTGTNQL